MYYLHDYELGCSYCKIENENINETFDKENINIFLNEIKKKKKKYYEYILHFIINDYRFHRNCYYQIFNWLILNNINLKKIDFNKDNILHLLFKDKIYVNDYYKQIIKILITLKYKKIYLLNNFNLDYETPIEIFIKNLNEKNYLNFLDVIPLIF